MMRRRGFTLVEMMVALSITAVLTVMMLRMFTDSSTIWKTEDERLETFREARAALQLMASALATAQPLPDAKPDPTKTGVTEEFPALALRSHTSRTTSGLSTDYYTEAYALAATPNAGASDLCALGFRLEWEPAMDEGQGAAAVFATTKKRHAFALRRQFAQSDTTFGLLRTALSELKPQFGKTAFGTLYGTTAPAGLPAVTVDTLATYVWDLQFAVPPRVGSGAAPETPQELYFGRELPAWIEVRFKALGSAAARKLEAVKPDKEVWSNPADPIYQRFILPSEQQFVSRVKLAR